jgi:DNA-binding response OmpR family regulator
MDATERDQQPARILLIDDDPALGGYLTRVLRTHPTVAYAVSALRNSAAEFLQKPIGAPELVAKATELITATARYWSRYCGGSHAEPFEVIRDRAGGLPARPAGTHSLVTP